MNPRDQLLERIFQNFEMLDAKIASSLDKIIQNSHFKKKVSRGQDCETLTPDPENRNRSSGQESKGIKWR